MFHRALELIKEEIYKYYPWVEITMEFEEKSFTESPMFKYSIRFFWKGKTRTFTQKYTTDRVQIIVNNINAEYIAKQVVGRFSNFVFELSVEERTDLIHKQIEIEMEQTRLANLI